MAIYYTIFDNILSSASLFIINNKDIIETYLCIENSVFQNIIFISTLQYNLLSFFNFQGNIFFNHCNFSEISGFNNIIWLENIGKLNFSSIIFDQNDVQAHLMSFTNISNITIIDTICQWTNGGALRIYNSLYRTIINFQINYSFTSKTAFGLKIIDEEENNFYLLQVLQPFVII